MEGTHNYAMNLIVPLMGIAPLLMVFILKGEKKTKRTKTNIHTYFLSSKRVESSPNVLFYVRKKERIRKNQFGIPVSSHP